MAKLIDLIVSGKSSFANDVNAKDIYADKFIKNGSSSSYVLLGDGSHKKWTSASEANTIVARDANGYILATYYNSNISNEDTITIGSVYVRNTTDNWIRRMSFTKFVENLYSNGLDGRYVNVSGDTMTGLLTVKTGTTNNGIKAGNTYINSIEGSLIFQNNTALRFGGADWDWNVWAGLKYVHSSKTIYLGLADNNAFTANSAQSGGKIYFPGIDNLYIGHGTYKLWHEGNDGSGSGLDADLLDGLHGSSYAIWRGVINTDPTAADVTSTDTSDFLTRLHNTSNLFGTNFSSFRGSWWYVGNTQVNTGVGTLEMAGTAVLNMSHSTGAGINYKSLLFLTAYGELYSFASEESGVATWSRYSKHGHTHDDRYYTESEADGRFVNVTGDTMTGTLAMSTGAAIHLWDDSATASHRLTLRNQSDIGRIYNYTGSAYGAMYIGHDGENAIVITSGQNVGVGTGSPSEKLSVNGWVGTIGNTGWYSITHAGGVHMTDSTWVRIYNNKKFYVNNSEYNAIHSAGGVYVAGCVHSYSNLLKTTYNGNTITIGSQNSSWGHIENSANINFYFNRSVHVDGALWRYNTDYGIDSDGKFYAHTVYANRSGSGTAGGVSLYSNSDPMTYGIASRNTADYGTHGSVTGDWATYLTMSNTSNRGWIFRTSDGTRRGSISALGHLNMDGNGYYGGNLSAANTGATSPDNAALEVREYSRAGSATGTAPHTIMYAPRIGFHWGNRYWANLAYFDSAFRFVNHTGASYVNIYCANMYGTASNVTVTDSNDNNTYRMVWHSGTGLYSTAGIYCNPNSDYLYATSMVTSSWFRSTGNTGWYSSSYGGGWYMTDTTWIRSYGGQGVVAGGFYHSSYGSANYLLTSNGGAWAVHTGRNNEANKIVRTDGSGYLQTGYINTNVGTEDTLSCSRLFFEYNSDGYIRKMSVDRFKSLLMDPTYLQRLRRANLNITTSDTGMIPPDILGLRNGYPLHTDPEFASGTNGISVYNNSGGSAVTVTRESSSTSGNSSGYCLHIHSAASGASPNGGGFYFATAGVKARTYICIFRAVIPSGYSVVFHTNSVGSGGNYGWLTSTDGTGKYEWYAHMVQFGTSPSSTFFFTLDRAAAVDWYLSYANVINVSNTTYDGLRTRYADYATDSNMVDGQHFSYSNSSNSPTYLWGTNSNGSSFLAARGSISVNYANSAGNADTVDSLHASAFMRASSDGSYYGLQDPAGSTANWIRTTTNGIIPATSGGASSLGTSSWPFSTVYGNNFYGYFNGNLSGTANRANYLSGHGVSPDNSHPGHGARVFYSWNIGQAGNSSSGYSNGITIGSHPSDTAYGFQIVQNMWDDTLYVRRYNAGWQSWRAVSYSDHGHRITKLHRRDDSSDYSLQHHWTGSYWQLRGYSGDSYHAGVQVAYADNSGYASSAGSAGSASWASYLPTLYSGGQQTNPQTYFNNGIGVRVAMTGMSSKGTSYWSDTLWINGYSGGDVPNMCALHFNRDGTPRAFISAQSNQSSSYGTFYELITGYNIGSQSVNYATYSRYVYCTSGSYLNFQWSGQGGQPSWLFGSNDGANVYVWNPSNFSVNYATSAGTASKLSSNAGSGTQQIYFSGGVPVASSSYVGSSYSPTFMSNGTQTVAFRFRIFSVSCFSSSNYSCRSYMGDSAVPNVTAVTYVGEGKLRATCSAYYTRCAIWGIGNQRGPASSSAQDSIYITINFWGGTYWYITLSDDSSGNWGRGWIYVVDFYS